MANGLTFEVSAEGVTDPLQYLLNLDHLLELRGGVGKETAEIP